MHAPHACLEITNFTKPGLFSDLHGSIRTPEVVMNQGPLPSGFLPASFTTDAQINYGSTLLGDVKPYSYGEPGHLADQV